MSTLITSLAERLSASRGFRGQRRRAAAPRPHRGKLSVEQLEDRTVPMAVPVGPEFRVNAFTSGDQRTFVESPQSVAALESGGFVTTWSSFGQNGGYWGTYGRVFDAEGNAGGEFRVNQTTDWHRMYSTVAALPGGGFVTTWSSYLQDGSSYGIYGRIFDAAGNPVSGEFRVNSTVAGDQWYSTVAALPGVGFVTTWTSSGQDGSGDGVYGRVFDANGNPVSGEFRLNTTVTGHQRYSTVAALPGGGFVTTWSSNGQDGSFYGVYGRIFDAAGNPVSGEFRVNSTITGDQHYSTVAALPNMGFVATWSSFAQDGSGYGVYGRLFDAAGNAVSGEILLSTTVTYNQQYSTVAALPGVGFVATWTSSGQDGSGDGVYGRLFNANGNPVGGEFRLNTITTNNQLYSTVAALPGGGFATMWSSAFQDGDGYGVYGQRFGLDTEPPQISNVSAVPNPFSPNGDGTRDRTTLSFTLSEDATVGMYVYDGLDRLVRTLRDSEPLVAFEHNTPWDGLDDLGNPVAEGRYSIKIHALDGAGNAALASFFDVVVDLTPPETLIDSAPPVLINRSEAVFDLSADEPGCTFEYRLDNGDWTAHDDPVQLQGLGDGTHTVEVRATDAAGNTDPSPARRSWTVDTVRPVVSAVSAAPDPFSPNGDEVRDRTTISYTVSEEASVSVYVYDGLGRRVRMLADNEPAAAGEHSLDWDGTDDRGDRVPDGSYTYSIDATDPAGNTADSFFDVFVVDTTPPELPQLPDRREEATGPDGAVVNYAGMAHDLVDGDIPLSFTPPSGSLLPPGHTSVRYEAVDTAGNRIDSFFDVFVELVAPILTVQEAVVRVDEGSQAVNGGTFTAPRTVSLTLTTSVGILDYPPGPAGTWTWEYVPDDGPTASQQVTIMASDGQGHQAAVSFELIVANVAPEKLIGPLQPGDTRVCLADGVDAPLPDPGYEFTKEGLELLDQHHDPDWGDNWCGPTAAGTSLGWFAENGYPDLVPDTNGNGKVDEEEKYAVIDTLGDLMDTDPDGGTTDDDFVEGIRDYLDSTGMGGSFVVKVFDADLDTTDPTFEDYARELEDGEDVLVGLEWTNDDGTTGGHWLTARSFSRADNANGNHDVSLVDPWDGSIAHTEMRDDGSMLYDGEWRTFDIMVSVSPIEEGSALPLNSYFVLDAGVADTVTATADWGDGTVEPLTLVPLRPGLWRMEGGHTYAGDGRQTLTLTITDDDGDVHKQQHVFDVLNVAPVLTMPQDQSAPAGVERLFDLGSFSDPGADAPWHVSVDWGDSSATDTIGTMAVDAFIWFATGPLPQRAHTYAVDGNYRVTVTVDDGGPGGRISSFFDVSVDNMAPVVTPPPNQSTREGVAKRFALGSFLDGDPDRPWRVTVDWGDGTSAAFKRQAPGTLPQLRHTYADDGTYRATVSVDDGHPGGRIDSFFDIFVENVAPTLRIAEDSVRVREGRTARNEGSVADLGNDAIDLTASVGSIAFVPGRPRLWRWSYTPADGPAETQRVTITASDGDGGVRSSFFDLIVRNVAPTASAPPRQTAHAGVEQLFNLGAFADPGADAPWHVAVNWGDGSPVDEFDMFAPGLLPQRAHTYASAGRYRVSVSVRDHDNSQRRYFFDIIVRRPASVAGRLELRPDGRTVAELDRFFAFALDRIGAGFLSHDR